MTYDEFLQREAQIDTLSEEAQKNFYIECLDTEAEFSDIRVHASYCLGALYFWEGNFRKAIHVTEPVILNYQSFPFSKKLLGCFNLLATAMHCEAEYVGARFVYGVALQLVREHGIKELYAREYNNIASVYVMEQNYSEALKYLEEAEDVLPLSEEPMGAFIYLNKAISLRELGQLQEAQQAYETAVSRYDSKSILPDDTLLCALTLYYSLGDMENYDATKQETLARLGEMHASEAMETCQNLFECAMDSDDENLLETIFQTMDAYMEAHPDEIKVGRGLAELKYRYAEKHQDRDAMLSALLLEKNYEDKMLSQTEYDRVNSMAKNFRIMAELQRAIDSKEKASQAKTQFLRSISHDIRTPLNGIIGLLKVDEAHSEDTGMIEKNRKQMQIAANHLLSLVNDVLDMSRIEDGSVKLSHEILNFQELYQQIMTIVAQGAAERRVTLRLGEAMPTNIPNVYGSPNHLRQIFLNIYSNCIKYNRVGGSVITDVALLQRDEQSCTLRWTISDTGIGMSSAFLAHIFEPFEQEQNDARSTYNGSGLGMSIAKSLAEQMGGTISVSSQVGVGSTFVVTIPFEIAPAAPCSEPSRAEIADISGLRLLLVEDNTLNADIAQILLSDRGAQITPAEDGQIALDLFAQSAPGTFDAILMDIMMPVMDGLTATKRIRALDRPDAKTIPIIAMTANAYAEDVKDCLNAGMNAHLGKPLDMDAVARTIAACCPKQA